MDRFRPQALLDQVTLAMPTVDPTGRWVVYTARTVERGRDRERLWRISTQGGDPVLLADVGQRCMRPRISPDGDRVLFLFEAAGARQVAIVSILGGAVRVLAGTPAGSRAADWCADGRHVALLAPSGVDRYIVGDAEDPTCRRIDDLTWQLDGIGIRDQHTSLWRADVDGSEAAIRLTPPTFEVSVVVPAPDGRIAFIADRGPERDVVERPSLHALDPAEGEITELVAIPGAIFAGAWSAAGNLATIGNEHPRSAAWHQHGLYVGMGQPRRLGGDRDVQVGNAISNDLAGLDTPGSPPVWFDEESLGVIVTDRGRSVPYRFGLDGSAQPLCRGDIVTGWLAAGGGAVVALAARDGRTAEVCRLEGGELHPITTHGAAWHARYQRVPVGVRVARRDGPDIDAWYLTGIGAHKPGPFVLEIHGGPNATHGPIPNSKHLALASAGIGVIWSNPRGSVSYGQAFAPNDLIASDAAASDLLAVADWAVAVGLADRERFGVTGASYGGYMTIWLLGHHPDRFKAGVSESPVTDLISEYGSADLALFDDLRYPDDAVRMLDVSPYRLIHRNTAPLLLIQPDGDRRCPPGQTELIYRILRQRGVVTEMIRYPDESHDLSDASRPDRRVDRLTRIVDWFTNHLV
jgi:dipeptidyl aminopeptidase/acylaminoacyl peptidase